MKGSTNRRSRPRRWKRPERCSKPNRLLRSRGMEPARSLFGLSAQAKARLIEKLTSAGPLRSARPASRSEPDDGEHAGRLNVTEFDGFREIRMIREAAEF